MQTLIDDFFVRHLSLTASEAGLLHLKYYKHYGLAIQGLAKHHKITPLDFNHEVDDALPLNDILTPNPALRKLLLAFDTSKVKLWLFTNAHITHGLRVVRLLGVEDLFEGITYCNYGDEKLVCKPHTEAYEKAEREAGVMGRLGECYFVDDSVVNCTGAKRRGWTSVHLVEPGLPEPEEMAGHFKIRELEELRGLFPHFF
jgi:pyrimidine and pyridine-specific 5'-nucleotidase